MNISKHEQRVLHALAQGGRIRHFRQDGKITDVICVTRDGMILSDCTLRLFRRLRTRGFIESRAGAPYTISYRGRMAVRAQPDNR
ncbi:YjhX family toxin [Paenirhodobacter sp. CAU 1674]|uniref:YjhX family toxin n=1 Tax=Paenirhodobacter sp. CAU 1674 TaxID=3032596 RepID=UPI0023DB5C17|nr:YjhX family toxin [Paenirhodobacter sp. CAU 1674]MDF2142666.1 YjhX family toxin [Paenirhodobacter sp. CAU 1674]